MPYDPETICKDREFISIIEMVVDVLLPSIGTGSSEGEHQSIVHPVKSDIRIIFVIGRELFFRELRVFRLFFVT